MPCSNDGVVVWLRNPFDPHERDVHHVQGSPTISQWLTQQQIVFEQPTLVLKNGKPVLVAERSVTLVEAGDVIALCHCRKAVEAGARTHCRRF